MSRVLVLGGSRSGKSAHAEHLLEGWAEVTYLATSRVDDTDAEWAARIAAHRSRRPTGWTTLETTTPSELVRGGAVLVDSITTWVAALMDETGVWATADAEGAGGGGHAADRRRADAAPGRVAPPPPPPGRHRGGAPAPRGPPRGRGGG